MQIIFGGGNTFNVDISAGVGTYTAYVVTGSSTSVSIKRDGGYPNFDFDLTSVSIKQVDPNDRWTLGDGFSFGDGKVSVDGSQSSNSLFFQNLGDLSNKTVKFSFVVSNYSAGQISTSFFGASGTTGHNVTANGNYSFVIAVQSGHNGNTGFTANSSFVGDITNVMVEQQKYVASNLKLNKGNYKSADPVIVSTKSVDLDGVEEHLDLGTQSATSSLTYSAWVKVTDTDASTILSYGNTLLRLGTATSIQYWSDVSEPQLNTSVSTLTNVWSHIVVTQTGQNVIIYLNGVQVNSTSSNPTINTGANISSIGRYAQGDLWYFTGQIDDVGIFNTALTSDQVIEIYNQGVPSNLATSSAGVDGALIGYWKMGDGTLDEAPLIADQTNATLGSELITGETGKDINTSGVYTDVNTNANTTTGDILQVTFTVTNSSGVITLFNYFGTSVVGSSTFTDGTHTQYLQITSSSSQTDLRFYSVSGRTGTLSNISIKKVNGNPALMINTPTIVTDAPLTKIRNYYRMGDGILDFFMSQTGSSSGTLTDGVICDMIEPSLGSELVINGDFSIAVGEPNAGWEAGSGWTIDTANNRAVRDNQQTDNTQIYQNIAVEQDKIYRLEYTREYLSGTGQTNIFSDFVTDNSFTTRGRFVNTETGKQFTIVSYFQPQYTGNFLLQVYGIGTFSGIITNVSMKKVNGVAGLMTNMLNTNITNDVPS